MKNHPLHLNIGCGTQSLPGWINIDCLPYPNVDRILDARKRLPYTNVRFIVAGHFIEHLALPDALRFLRECRRVLEVDGVLRLSTPNLDWVYMTQYRTGMSGGEALRACFTMNRSFYGWGHQFLYNKPALEALLRHAGFAEIFFCSSGESGHEALRGVDTHEPYPDSPECPHLLVAEAWGRAHSPQPEIEAMTVEYKRDVQMPWHGFQYAALWSIRTMKRLFHLR
jgi:hypothetical protein